MSWPLTISSRPSGSSTVLGWWRGVVSSMLPLRQAVTGSQTSAWCSKRVPMSPLAMITAPLW